MNGEIKEICWNIVNSVIAGMLVFFGSFIDGSITTTELIASLGAAMIIMITKFRDYWSKEEKEYKSICKTVKGFNFF